MFGANLGYDSPYIAVVATGRMREELGGVQNGKVHRYGATASRKDSRRSEPSPPPAAPSPPPHRPVAAAVTPEALKVELDSHHTHFIIVDGPQQGAEELRNELEYYISSQDAWQQGLTVTQAH